HLLRRARTLGDRLIVGLSTDAFNHGKHKSALLDYPTRKVVLEAIRYVDMAIPESTWEQKVDDIRKYDVDTFVICNDWEGKFDFLKAHCRVVYLSRTPEISSTLIRESLAGVDQERP